MSFSCNFQRRGKLLWLFFFHISLHQYKILDIFFWTKQEIIEGSLEHTWTCISYVNWFQHSSSYKCFLSTKTCVFLYTPTFSHLVGIHRREKAHSAILRYKGSVFVPCWEKRTYEKTHPSFLLKSDSTYFCSSPFNCTLWKMCLFCLVAASVCFCSVLT